MYIYLKAVASVADPKNQIFLTILGNYFMKPLQIYIDF